MTTTDSGQAASGAARTATEIKTSDGRTIGLFVPADFSDFESYPPFIETEEEREHMRTAYQVSDPERERYTKAHLTPNDLPLQVIVLNRDKAAVTKAHYHEMSGAVTTRTRHEILICLAGAARVELWSAEGEKGGEVVLRTGDTVLMYEGHAVEFLEDGTRLIEIKQGPFPDTEWEDKTDLN